MEILTLDHGPLLFGQEPITGYMLIGMSHLIDGLKAIFRHHGVGDPNELALNTLSSLSYGDGYALVDLPGSRRLIVKRQPFRDYKTVDTYLVQMLPDEARDYIWQPLIAMGWANDEWYPAISSKTIEQRFTQPEFGGRAALSLEGKGGVFDQVKDVLVQPHRYKEVVHALATTVPHEAGLEYGDGLVIDLTLFCLKVRLGNLAPIEFGPSGATVPIWDRAFCHLHVNVVEATAPTLIFEWSPLPEQDYFSMNGLTEMHRYHDLVWKALHALRRELAA